MLLHLVDKRDPLKAVRTLKKEKREKKRRRTIWVYIYISSFGRRIPEERRKKKEEKKAEKRGLLNTQVSTN